MGIIISIIVCLVFCLIAGVIARLLVPGRQTMSYLMTAVLGIVGSFAGGALSYLLFGAGDSLIRPSGLIMSVIGAIIVLLIYGWYEKQGKSKA